MKITCIDRYTPQEVINPILVRLRNILVDLEICYPFFTLWLEKVFLELLSSDSRKILLCIEGNCFNILGIAILKNNPQEKKICTLRVQKEYQRRGIGTALLRRSIEELKEPFPLITVSGIQMDSFGPFLIKNGFILKDKVKSIYRKGSYEYFFNKEYKHQVALMSIQPIYSKEISAGRKTIEFRKRIFASTVNKVFVYESSPTKKIIGYFEVTVIDEDSPLNLWNKYCSVGCISKEKFDEYYKGHVTAYGIHIKQFHKFENPLDPLSFDKDFRAPQSYCYIDNVELLNWLSNPLCK